MPNDRICKGAGSVVIDFYAAYPIDIDTGPCQRCCTTNSKVRTGLVTISSTSNSRCLAGEAIMDARGVPLCDPAPATEVSEGDAPILTTVGEPMGVL